MLPSQVKKRKCTEFGPIVIFHKRLGLTGPIPNLPSEIARKILYMAMEMNFKFLDLPTVPCKPTSCKCMEITTHYFKRRRDACFISTNASVISNGIMNVPSKLTIYAISTNIWTSKVSCHSFTENWERYLTALDDYRIDELSLRMTRVRFNDEYVLVDPIMHIHYDEDFNPLGFFAYFNVTNNHFTSDYLTNLHYIEF